MSTFSPDKPMESKSVWIFKNIYQLLNTRSQILKNQNIKWVI